MSKDALLLGIDLGATNVRAGLVRGSDLVRVESVPIDPNGTAEDVMRQVLELIDVVWDAAIEGIGVGVPSVVDVEDGVVYDVQNIPSMREVPMKALLQDRYGRPAFVNNDVNCFVLGEHTFGKAKGYDHVAGLNLGTGFAAGLILNGRLYEGPNCGAGEFGMIPYLESILEDYCSGRFFIRRGLDAAEMHRLAWSGDGVAVSLWQEFGRHVGQAVKTVLYAVDPEIIVVGGSIRKAYDHFKDAMWETVREFAYTRTLDRLKLELSDLDHAALLGAAVLPAAFLSKKA